MQKQSYKKILTALILSLLVLSVLPIAISPVAAITITEFRDEDYVVITEGNVGDTVIIIGTGATPLGRVRAYWDGWEDEDELATEPSRPKGNATSGYEGNYEFNITIPEDVTGIHFIGVKDVMSEDIISAAFYIEPKIALDPDTGLKGDTITANLTGYGAELEITMWLNDTFAIYYDEELDTTPDTVETNDLGSFYDVEFRVPDLDYGDYDVYAWDEDVTPTAHWAKAVLTVGATITLTPEEGPTGTVVTIEGRGFERRAGREIWVTVNGVNATEVDDIETTSAGAFEGEIVIPTLAVDEYTVMANQTTGGTAVPGKGTTATADFEVTGKTGVILTPESGPPGLEVTIEGINFTAIEGTEVEVKFETLVRATLETNETGGFIGTFTVPSLPTDVYTIETRDENDLWNTTTFQIAVTFLTVDPVKGPAGTNVTLTAYGLSENGVIPANATFDDILVLEDERTTDFMAGVLFFFVPSVPKGVYTITVEDDLDLSASTKFEVNATTTVTMDPEEAPVNLFVTVSGEGFSPKSEVEMIIYNATWDTEIANDTSPIRTDADGNFEFEWNATADDDVLALGDYWINASDIWEPDVTDPERIILVNEVPFGIVEATLTVSTGASRYARGDLVDFRARSSFKTNVSVVLWDPTGFNTTFTIETATKSGLVYLGTRPYALSSDAELGDWDWEAEAFDKEMAGSFEVVEEITVGTIEERIADLEEAISDVSDLIDELSEKVKEVDLTPVSDAIDAVKSDVEGIKGDVSDAKDAAEAAGADASDAKDAAEAAGAAAAGLSMTVYGVLIIALIAAVAAILAAVQIQRKVVG